MYIKVPISRRMFARICINIQYKNEDKTKMKMTIQKIKTANC